MKLTIRVGGSVIILEDPTEFTIFRSETIAQSVRDRWISTGDIWIANVPIVIAYKLPVTSITAGFGGGGQQPASYLPLAGFYDTSGAHEALDDLAAACVTAHYAENHPHRVIDLRPFIIRGFDEWLKTHGPNTKPQARERVIEIAGGEPAIAAGVDVTVQNSQYPQFELYGSAHPTPGSYPG